ncbi:membrane dipeptidase [soil metagenome]
MILIDGHIDVALNALVYNRDLKKSALDIRIDEAEMTQKGRARGTIGLPDLRDAEVAITFITCLARVRANPGENAVLDFRTHEAAFAHAQAELAYYRELERQGIFRIISDLPTLNAHMEQWRADSSSCPLGAVLTMEGADPIVSPDRVHSWWDQGLRVLSLAHYGPSQYAFGTGSEGPVTADGLALLDEMSSTKMILDVTHLCDESFWIAVDRFSGPLIATHSNCRSLVPAERQFSDDQLKLLIERDAVIGAAMDAWMIEPGWIQNVTEGAKVTLEDYVNHIDHVCQLAGNARHAAIGTDLDGGYGTEQTPRDFDTYIDMQLVPELLRDRGYSESDIEAICYGNWLRKLTSVWAD